MNEVKIQLQTYTDGLKTRNIDDITNERERELNNSLESYNDVDVQVLLITASLLFKFEIFVFRYVGNRNYRISKIGDDQNFERVIYLNMIMIKSPQ